MSVSHECFSVTATGPVYKVHLSEEAFVGAKKYMCHCAVKGLSHTIKHSQFIVDKVAKLNIYDTLVVSGIIYGNFDSTFNCLSLLFRLWFN